MGESQALSTHVEGFSTNNPLKSNLKDLHVGTNDDVDEFLAYVDKKAHFYSSFAHVSGGQYFPVTADQILKVAKSNPEQVYALLGLGYIKYPQTSPQTDRTRVLYRGIFGANLVPIQRAKTIRDGIFTEEFIESIRKGERTITDVLTQLERRGQFEAYNWKQALEAQGINDFSRNILDPKVLNFFINYHKNNLVSFGDAFWISTTSDPAIAVQYFTKHNPSSMFDQQGFITGVFSCRIPEDHCIDASKFPDNSEIEQSEYLVWGVIKPEWQRVFVPKGEQRDEVVLETLKAAES